MIGVRKTLFFGVDALRGGLVRAHLRDLAEFEQLNSELQEERVKERLQSLLRHAADTTRHYSRFKGATDLSQYPVVTKKELVEGKDHFLSSVFRQNDLRSRCTSGSYGTPMKVFFSPEKFARQQAEIIHFNRTAGLEVGDRYINITSNTKKFLERFMKNGVIINPSVMSPAWFDATIDTLRRNSHCTIVGFPSVLYALAQVILSGSSDADICMNAIVSIAESLPRHVSPIISRAFRCPVFNRYASMETGVLAHSRQGEEGLFINCASYVVELLSVDSDRPAREGEEGRVIVTDLYSDAMPLIRYDIGDRAVLRQRGQAGVHRMEAIEGRVAETIYDTQDRQVSWAILYDILTYTGQVIQYQFCQLKARHYRVKLIVDSEWSQSAEQNMEQRFRQVLGTDACIEFDYPESIPPLPSGKRPMIVNLTSRSA